MLLVVEIIVNMIVLSYNITASLLFTVTHRAPQCSFPLCLSRDQEIFLWRPISRSVRDKGQSVMGRQQLSFGPQPPLPFLACVFVCVGVPLGAEQHLLLVVKCRAVEWLGTGRGCGDVQPLVALLCGGGLSVCSPDRLS